MDEEVRQFMPKPIKVPKDSRSSSLFGSIVPEEIDVDINQIVPSVIKVDVNEVKHEVKGDVNVVINFPALDRLMDYLESLPDGNSDEVQEKIDELTAQMNQSSDNLAASLEENKEN